MFIIIQIILFLIFTLVMVLFKFDVITTFIFQLRPNNIKHYLKIIFTKLFKIAIVFILIFLFDETLEFEFVDRCIDRGGGYIKQYPAACINPRQQATLNNLTRFATMGLYSLLIVIILHRLEKK